MKKRHPATDGGGGCTTISRSDPLPHFYRTSLTYPPSIALQSPENPFQMAAPHSLITPSLRGIDQLIDRHREDDERADGSFCKRSAREEAGAANHLEHLFICLPMKSFLRESPQL